MGFIKKLFRSPARRSEKKGRRRDKRVFDEGLGDHLDEGSLSLHPAGPISTAEERVKRMPQYSKKSVSSKYRLGNIIGTGGFSIVRHAKNRETGEEFACKIMKLPKKECESQFECMSREAMFNEIEIASRVHCPHIAHVEEFFVNKSKIYIIMDLMKGGILMDSMSAQENQRYKEDDARRIFRQVLRGISYLHARNVAHRDLKLQNLMLVNKNDLSHIKIVDMGLAKQLTTNTNSTCGSPLFIAPEVISRTSTGYGLAVDMWSAGVILFALLGGYPPFHADHELDLFSKIKICDYNFDDPLWNGISESAKDLIAQCLVVDPEDRFTATQALNHPWIRGCLPEKSFDCQLCTGPDLEASFAKARKLPSVELFSRAEGSSSKIKSLCSQVEELCQSSDLITGTCSVLIQLYVTSGVLSE